MNMKLNRLWAGVLASLVVIFVAGISPTAGASERSEMLGIVHDANSFNRLVQRLDGKISDQSAIPVKVGPVRKVAPSYRDIIRRAATTYMIPAPLIAAVIKCESNWQAHAHSRAGARGLMQVLPRTAAGEFQVEPGHLWDPAVNIQVGTAYLRILADRYGGNPATVIAAYNAGPGRIESGRPVPRETRHYVGCVRRWAAVYGGWKQ